MWKEQLLDVQFGVQGSMKKHAFLQVNFFFIIDTPIEIFEILIHFSSLDIHSKGVFFYLPISASILITTFMLCMSSWKLFSTKMKRDVSTEDKLEKQVYSQVSNKRACSFIVFGVFALSAGPFLCKRQKVCPPIHVYSCM